jgi:hypothetical protein
MIAVWLIVRLFSIEMTSYSNILGHTNPYFLAYGRVSAASDQHKRVSGSSRRSFRASRSIRGLQTTPVCKAAR